MIKKLWKSVREYKPYVFITLFFIIGEAVIETLIPFITADLINQIKNGIQMDVIVKKGLLLAAMAVLSVAVFGPSPRPHDEHDAHSCAAAAMSTAAAVAVMFLWRRVIPRSLMRLSP